MRVRVGTSGYSFKEWKGHFYPADLPADGMLGYYASKFPTVEINNTFYRMPKEKVVMDWAAAVPDDFRFVLKASQRITHFSRLRDVGNDVSYFCRIASSLGEKRGPSLFQLPPNLKLDLALLDDFLAVLPRGWRTTIEFRHPTWFADAVYDALRARDVALTIAEQDDFATPVVATASWGYLRLHKMQYGGDQLAGWAERIGRERWSEAYVFFKHEDEGSGPEVALELQKLVQP